MSRRPKPVLPAAVAATIPLQDPVIMALVRRAAAAVCRRLGFTAADRDDVTQALFTTLHQSYRRYRPRRGAWRAYAATVIARRAATLARDRRSPRRAPGARSLSDRDVPRDRRRPAPSADPADTVPLALDVARVLADAPPGLRALAERLMAGERLTPAAKAEGIPRGTARGRLARLLRRFDDPGLWEEV